MKTLIVHMYEYFTCAVTTLLLQFYIVLCQVVFLLQMQLNIEIIISSLYSGNVCVLLDSLFWKRQTMISSLNNVITIIIICKHINWDLVIAYTG